MSNFYSNEVKDNSTQWAATPTSANPDAGHTTYGFWSMPSDPQSNAALLMNTTPEWVSTQKFTGVALIPAAVTKADAQAKSIQEKRDEREELCASLAGQYRALDIELTEAATIAADALIVGKELDSDPIEELRVKGERIRMSFAEAKATYSVLDQRYEEAQKERHKAVLDNAPKWREALASKTAKELPAAVERLEAAVAEFGRLSGMASAVGALSLVIPADDRQKLSPVTEDAIASFNESLARGNALLRG